MTTTLTPCGMMWWGPGQREVELAAKKRVAGKKLLEEAGPARYCSKYPSTHLPTLVP